MALRTRWLILPAPIIIAVIFGGTVAPSRAVADCGNYVVYTDPAHRPAMDQPMGEHQSPVRCHGPRCSQAPLPAPMPPAPPNLRILADDPLVISTAESLIPPTFESYPSNVVDGDVVRRPTDIFHPPR
jgi:hypothetical protein